MTVGEKLVMSAALTATIASRGTPCTSGATGSHGQIAQSNGTRPTHITPSSTPE